MVDTTKAYRQEKRRFLFNRMRDALRKLDEEPNLPPRVRAIVDEGLDDTYSGVYKHVPQKQGQKTKAADDEAAAPEPTNKVTRKSAPRTAQEAGPKKGSVRKRSIKG
jgi:hypothetical protein